MKISFRNLNRFSIPNARSAPKSLRQSGFAKQLSQGIGNDRRVEHDDRVDYVIGIFDPIENRWIGENLGIPPDIEVIQDARSVSDGRDPQLERGVEELLRLLNKDKPRDVMPPPFSTPSRRGPGQGSP